MLLSIGGDRCLHMLSPLAIISKVLRVHIGNSFFFLTFAACDWLFSLGNKNMILLEWDMVHKLQEINMDAVHHQNGYTCRSVADSIDKRDKRLLLFIVPAGNKIKFS